MQSNLAPHRQAKRLQMSEEMMPSMSGELGDKVACNRCGAYVDYVKCKLQSKKAFTWTCPTCGSSTTTLRRHFGTWPIDTFSMLSSDAQTAFYNSIKVLKSVVAFSIRVGRCSTTHVRLEDNINTNHRLAIQRDNPGYVAKFRLVTAATATRRKGEQSTSKCQQALL